MLFVIFKYLKGASGCAEHFSIHCLINTRKNPPSGHYLHFEEWEPKAQQQNLAQPRSHEGGGGIWTHALPNDTHCLQLN